MSDPIPESGLIPTDAAGPPHLSEPLFETDTPLAFTLEADFPHLREDRSQESEERPGRVVLAGGSGWLSYPVKVRTRGRFRLNSYICSAPPLRLNFPKDSLVGSPLEGLDKVKLVTHCRDNDPYEQNVLEEYLAYRFYGLLTPVAFKVQLARITYRDVTGRDEDVSRLAFLIEAEEVLAERLGGEIVEVEHANPNHLVPRQAGLMYLFQYLIGNTDWALVHPHNMKFVRTREGFYPLPYDFDFSGLVDAPYAGPSPVVARYISSVRDRKFWGVCSDRIDYAELFGHFNEHRAELVQLIQNLPGLSGWNARRAEEYVESFFAAISDSRHADYLAEAGCRPLGG